ncbi:AP-5 complex subunit beta-1-like isoform X2 [Ptychodera flava]
MYRCQILVTVTTILIQHDQLEHQPKIFIEFVDLLLSVISKINDAISKQLRRTACECLREIEINHPGILIRKLEHLFAMSQLENTCIGQSYVLLFVTVLKNTIDTLVRSGDEVPANELTDLLCNRKEPLKPLTLPENFTPEMFSLMEKIKSKSSHGKLASHIDSRELKKAISFVMEYSSLMTSSALFSVMLQLMECVSHVDDLSPATFKSQFIHCVTTIDFPLFHLVFLLKARFTSELFSDVDEELLLRRLLIYANSPSFTLGRQLLCYEWLLHFPENQIKSSSDCCIPSKLDYSYFASFFPSIFDGVDTIVSKLNVLNLCFKPGTTADSTDSATAILMSSLAPLQKSVNYGVMGTVAVALYKTLFLYYKRHHNSSLAEEIYKCLLAIIMEHPKFAAQTIDFLESIREFQPESSFPVDLLRALTEQTVSTQMASILGNLQHYLMILERAAQEKDIKPNTILLFLQQLLVCSDLCNEGSWTVGNSILGVCKHILQCHNTDLVFRELGDLLFLLFTKYNEVDIRDRARFYYALLTNLSSQKLTSILTSFSPAAMATSQTLTSLVTGSANFATALPVQNVENPVLQLTRAAKNFDEAKLSVDVNGTEEILETYLTQVKRSDFAPLVVISYYVHFTQSSDTTKYNKLYAIVVHLVTSNNYKEMKDIELPTLSRMTSSQPSKTCNQITFEFCPCEPVPAKFDVSVIFSSEDGKTCRCVLEPLQLQFEDLFLPLPTISTINKQHLFQDLWNHIHSQQDQSDTNCTESVCCLHLSQDIVEKTIRERLSPFVVLSPQKMITSTRLEFSFHHHHIY